MKKRKEMVKTRHQTGIEEMPSHLYTVETRSRRRSVIVEDGGESDSDRSDYAKYHSKRHRREGSSMKVEDSLAKYSKEDTSNAPSVSRTRYPHRRQHHALGEESEDHTPEKEGQKGTSMASISSHSSTSHAFMNGDCNSDEKQCVRRSTRQRKFIYDNLNQTWLLASSIPEFAKLDPLFDSNKQIRQDDDKNMSKRSERKRNYELRRLGLGNTEMEFEDMYSRVKRERRKSVHEFYSRRVSQDVGSMEDTEDTDQNDSTDEDDVDEVGSDMEGASASGEEESQEEGAPPHSKYCLRPKKPITERFQFPIEPARPKRSAPTSLFHTPPHHRQPRERHTFKSPAHRSPLFRRKRHATHNISSTSSSSDDERRFERRKARSMARARSRCLPLNFREEDATKGVLRDRAKIGTSLADIDPMNIDRLIKFNSVGGLDQHIKALKEMILFPLMYPEVFEKFKISPPRGVLFHGPPGTGKTLVARALANECSQGNKHVAFFMRKGADCLSKWVGESERQLRLLFDQAYSMRPSIIFFDEIDGLAPVRSTRQDQIHSSIVSTLLALMDGLDSRGEIVVIGATNRIDAIDPALRRPGRFDREFFFPLPPLQARCTILCIHTKDWQPSLSEDFVKELAVKSAGYCGADLKALCAEAALIALRRRYPQIYSSEQKLKLDVNSIQIQAQDFEKAMKKIVPAAHRSSFSPASPLPSILVPLLQHTLLKALNILKRIYPAGMKKSLFYAKGFDMLKHTSHTVSASESEMSSEEQSDDNSDYDQHALLSSGSDGPRSQGSSQLSYFQDLRLSHHKWPPGHRPRLLLSGRKDQGQSIHLAPAVLYYFDHLPVHRLDLPTLYAVSCRAPEEACAQVFREALKTLPSILYLPHIGQWWETMGETVRATFLTLLHDIEPRIPLLLLATSDSCFEHLPPEVQDLFTVECHVLQMKNPTSKERREFFSLLITKQLLLPPKHRKKKEKCNEVLPIVPPPEPRKLTESELEKLRQQEEATLRELRLFLREILNKLARDRRFSVFTKPVDPDEVPDYHEVIKNPMDLETMMSKIDLHHYETVSQFLADIDLICHNALEYNPDRDPSDKLIRHRACALKDTAHALVDSELDEEFEKICLDIHEARKQRGETPTKYAPKHYHVLPRNLASRPIVIQRDPSTENSLGNDGKDGPVSLSQSYPTRFSRRLRGMATTPPSSDTEALKKNLAQPAPRRPTQYMIWRKRKSPWFGCCRRKLIRRPIHHKQLSQNVPKLVVKEPDTPNVSNEKPTPLSPVPEVDAPDKQESEKQIEKDKPQIEAEKQTDADTEVDAPLSPTKNIDLFNSNSPEIVYVSAVKNSGVTNLSTSECNTAHTCDKLHQHEYCSNDTPSNECKESADKCAQNQVQENLLTSGQDIINEESSISDLACKQTSDSSSKVQEPDIPRQVIVDVDHLHKLLEFVVNLTEGYSVEMLQQLHCILQRCIYRHRKDWDKSILLQELQKEVMCFQRYTSS